MITLRDYIKQPIEIKEQKKQELVLEPLPVKSLAPVMSKATIDYHYSTLAKGYVDRYNKGEGDPIFNMAGAFLHNVFFPQFTYPKQNNKPFGMSQQFIHGKFGSFAEFKRQLKDVAMKIQGSGWVYLSDKGEIKTIPNHQVRKDIILLIDWWEHAWALDYQADKAKYLENIWSIIDWKIINDRLTS